MIVVHTSIGLAVDEVDHDPLQLLGAASAVADADAAVGRCSSRSLADHSWMSSTRL